MKIEKITPEQKEELQGMIPEQVGDIDPEAHKKALEAVHKKRSEIAELVELPKNG